MIWYTHLFIAVLRLERRATLLRWLSSEVPLSGPLNQQSIYNTNWGLICLLGKPGGTIWEWFPSRRACHPLRCRSRYHQSRPALRNSRKSTRDWCQDNVTKIQLARSKVLWSAPGQLDFRDNNLSQPVEFQGSLVKSISLWRDLIREIYE